VALGGVLWQVGTMLDVISTGLQGTVDLMLFLARQAEKLKVPGAKVLREGLEGASRGLKGGENAARVGSEMVKWGEDTGWRDKYQQASWQWGTQMQQARTGAEREFAGQAWQPTSEAGIPGGMMDRADRLAGAVLDVVEKRLRDYVNGNAAWQRTSTVRAGAGM
jgi:hypothetical protein